MDDPTKDTIPRSAVEYCLRKETVSTNPEAYKAHKKFIGYMDDPEISQFGHWMHTNGYNCALLSVAVDLEKIPSVTPSSQPGWIPCSVTSPKNGGKYYVTQFRYDVYDTDMIGAYVRETDYIWYSTFCKKWLPDRNCKVVAWMPHIEPWEGDANG